VARDIFEAEKLVNFTPQDGLLSQLAGGVGASLASRIRNFLLTPHLGY